MNVPEPRAGRLAIGLVAGLVCLAPAWAADGPDATSRHVAILTSQRQHAAALAGVLREAWALNRRGHGRQAAERFERVLADKGATPAERVQAMYGMATVRAFGKPAAPAEARGWLERIIAEHPGNPVVPWAHLELGRLAVAADGAPGREKARERFRNVIEGFPESPAIHEATLRLASTHFFELDPVRAARGTQTLEAHLARYPDNPLNMIMHFWLMYWYQLVDRDYDRGLAHSVQLGRLKMCDPGRWGQYLWNTAQVYNLRKDNPREALKWYRKLLAEAPHDRMRGDAMHMIELIERRLGKAAATQPGRGPKKASKP